MAALMRTTDAKGRVLLPAGFANATVLLDVVGEGELRIRRAAVVPVEELRFSEERPIVLTDAERDRFLALLADPPKPGKAFRKAASRKAAHA